MPSGSTRLTLAFLYSLPPIVLKSSARASDADSAAKIAAAVWQNFTRWILPVLLSTSQWQNDMNGRNDSREQHQTRFTKSARAKTNAALIWFPMRCLLVACGMASQTRWAIQSGMPRTAADQIMPSFAFMIRLETWSKRTSRRAISKSRFPGSKLIGLVRNPVPLAGV